MIFITTPPPIEKSNQAFIIALVIIGLFIASVFAIAYLVYLVKPDDSLTIMIQVIAFLEGLVATIIGFYFGKEQISSILNKLMK